MFLRPVVVASQARRPAPKPTGEPFLRSFVWSLSERFHYLGKPGYNLVCLHFLRTHATNLDTVAMAFICHTGI